MRDGYLTYRERHTNSAPKIRLATMASHKARDGLSPRALVMWLVIMTLAVSASQSPNISQTQSKQCADGNILDASWCSSLTLP